MRKSGDLSRQALLEASCRLFAERGMTVVKLSEIAREAGVDACMVNYHFGGKEERETIYLLIGTTLKGTHKCSWDLGFGVDKSE